MQVTAFKCDACGELYFYPNRETGLIAIVKIEYPVKGDEIYNFHEEVCMKCHDAILATLNNNQKKAEV